MGQLWLGSCYYKLAHKIMLGKRGCCVAVSVHPSCVPTADGKEKQCENLGKWKVNAKVMQRANSVVGREDDPEAIRAAQARGFDFSAHSGWHVLVCLLGEGPSITGAFPVEINDSLSSQPRALEWAPSWCRGGDQEG